MRLDKTTSRYLEGRHNKALERAVEEERDGLAQDEPLVLESRLRGRGQEHIYGRREPWASFYEDMPDEMLHAARIISICHRAASGATFMRTMTYVLEGGGGRRPDDVRAAYSDMERRYIDWRAALHKTMPKVLDACIAVFGQGMNFSEAARASHGLMSDKTVKRYCWIGLEEFVALGGKKNQKIY